MVFSKQSSGGLVGTSQANLTIEATPVELAVVGELLITDGVSQAAFIGSASTGASQTIDYTAFKIRGIFDHCGCLDGVCSGIPDAACDQPEYEIRADTLRESGRVFQEDGSRTGESDGYVEVCTVNHNFNYNSTIVRLADSDNRFSPDPEKKYLFSPFCGSPIFFRLTVVGQLVSPVNGVSAILQAASQVQMHFVNV